MSNKRPSIKKIERIGADVFITMKVRIAFLHRKENRPVYNTLSEELLRIRYTNEVFHRKKGGCLAYYSQEVCEDDLKLYLCERFDMTDIAGMIKFDKIFAKRDGKIRQAVNSINIVSTEEEYRKFKINQLLR